MSSSSSVDARLRSGRFQRRRTAAERERSKEEGDVCQAAIASPDEQELVPTAS
jgi:hypothetical protein